MMRFAITLMLTLATVCFQGCSAITSIWYSYAARDHFIELSADPRIKYEPGAEEFASAVHLKFSAAIKAIEDKQFASFPASIAVYVCKSPESFEEVTGHKVAAMTYRESIFLSPEIRFHPRSVGSYLKHELSHLLLFQKLGGIKYTRIPSWFLEGLATYVSGGGGSEKVSDAEAKDAIRNGNSFQPIEDAGLIDLLRPKYASYWGIEHKYKHHMFYRQCMLFVAFLEQNYPEQFQKLLIELHQGSAFSDSFHSSFRTDVMARWNEFKVKEVEASPAVLPPQRL